MEDSFVFSSILNEVEWQTVPKDLGKKLEKFVSDKFEEFITAKALLETKCFNLEKGDNDLVINNEKLLLENQNFIAKLEIATKTINEHEAQISIMTAEIGKLHNQCNDLESETAQFRHERNLAIDERDEKVSLMNRREAEIERLKQELNIAERQLDAAVNAKCEMMATSEEVLSMKTNLEYKEQRLEQERTLLAKQMESLTEELDRRTEELLNMRRDNSSTCIQLQTKLTQKIQELAVANDQIKAVTELNTNLTVVNEELAQKMSDQRSMDAKMSESYVFEIEAKTKMADAYKNMYEESQQLVDELKEGLAEVQRLLKDATDQYGELETKYKESQLSNEEIISKKNECIELLKKELETANELLENSKTDIDGEGMSASFASASKLTKSGMTYSELYSRYVNLSDKLTNKEEECSRLNNFIETIVREMEGNYPKMRKLHEDYTDSVSAIDALKENNEQLLNEVQALREANSECKRAEGIHTRENERLKKEVADLSRQVVVLLQEVENSRIGSSSTSTDNDLSDSVNSADIISKKLVTFNDITELQANNIKLLALVRELSERQEEVESLDPSAIARLKAKLDELMQSQNELLEERDRQIKMMATLRNQKDMYKNLYAQAVKSTGEELPDGSFLSDSGEPKLKSDSETQLEEKIRDLEGQVAKLSKQVDHLKEENETYRKEKSANEKILLEQMDNMRGEVKELTRLNCKLSSHADLNEEKFKVLNNNMEIYKKQITALEKQNKIYSEAIVKHEQAATYLKDETIKCQMHLSRAEVKLSNLEKENSLLKDAEHRLLKERDSLKRDSHQQNLIRSNMELIKATLERTDAEGKIRLETRLDEAYRECAALRRRLQEEQDHFRELSDQLSQRSKTAVTRAEEEREIAEKLRKEVAEVREDLITKSLQNEELSKKLKSGLFVVPDTNSETRKVRELEQQVSDLQAEIESLKKKLKTAKDASDEYYQVAQSSEKQVQDAVEKKEAFAKELEKQKSRVKELEEKCSELEGELSIQLDDQDIMSAGIKSKSTQLQEELNIRSLDLQTAKEQLENSRSEIRQLVEQLKAVENKYAREVTLHSVDLQSLTTMKEELDKALGEVNNLQRDKQNAINSLEQFQSDWEKQKELFENEKNEIETRFNDMDSQNSLLHDQIQALNTQLGIIQAQATDSQNTSIGDSSFSRSFTEDEVKSSEQLLKIIKYLRQEKDIAVSKADIIDAEHSRLKSQFDMINKQYEEMKLTLENERQKVEVSVVSAAKHSEVLRKLETLNAITDSNRTLRQERDTLVAQITELRSRADTFETEVEPLQEKNRELTTKADQLQSENISLRAECTRWRQRANMLIEKTNRTSPEDWKKLQTERETLAKQLTIERSNVVKLNDDISNLRQDKTRLEDQLKSLRAQNNNQAEEIAKLREDVAGLQAQVTQLTNTVDQQSAEVIKSKEEIRVLSEDVGSKDATITELRNNLAQVRKIAKKYKIQCEDQSKEIDGFKVQQQQHESDQLSNVEKQEQMENQRLELEEKVIQLENAHKEAIELLNQEIAAKNEQIEGFKKEIENLKQVSQDKEERFKTLFKNAKERIMSLTEQNTGLKDELRKQDTGRSDGGETSKDAIRNSELLEKIAALERERDEASEERQQEQERHAAELETLNQKILQLQRQTGHQQGSKPSTSSSSSEKSSTERPTADIKPMAGHSTNTQTQSVPIQPWRSGGEPPLASIRPMSAQLRTVAVLPTSQSPSAVMVPPQQQVHTTGSSSIEALSSSPTSSHTEYVPATSSASPAMLGPRQVAVPPTQSSQDTEDDENNVQVQAAPQTQAVALVLPRVEPPSGSSGPTQEQGTSSSSSNTVTTTQAGHKRQREADMDSSQSDDQSKTQQLTKRTRIQAGTVSDSGLDVEYQVPTSSQRDHDDDNVIVVESDEEGGADEGEGADDEQDDPDTEGYDMEGMEQDNYEDTDCPDEEDEEEAGNEVEVMDDSSEVPNQSERSVHDSVEEENSEQPQSEAISSGTDGTTSSSAVTISQVSTTLSMTVPSFSRSRPIAPLPSRQQQSHLLPFGHGLEDIGDDGIVPSTPTLYVPRRSDGFGEAVSSPHVPTSGRFTFNESTTAANVAGSSGLENVPEQTLEPSNLDENSTGRSVPTTPLQSSPQEGIPGSEDQGGSQMTQSDEIPSIAISGEADDSEVRGEGSSGDMGPPGLAGTSSESSHQVEEGEEIAEGDDGVSSEGEKPPLAEEGEEEGREAEASPSTNSRRTVRGSNSARRSVRPPAMQRGNQQHRSGPTPIVWGDRSPQRNQHGQDRGRGSPPGNYQARTVARRARGRMQRPFGRY